MATTSLRVFWWSLDGLSTLGGGLAGTRLRTDDEMASLTRRSRPDTDQPFKGVSTGCEPPGESSDGLTGVMEALET